ncbi:kelch-like ECH-associated protein 1B [Amphiura filiformis]|uniref:kelch-like ECH-associated protein 1B n=1 Tax=Amphiura filiformis TaxID=82378 RepID=UPI003B22248E
MCWSELGEHISPNNCIGVWVLAGRLGSQEMARSLSKYILKNFLDVHQGREFLKLAPNSLFSFLKQESLNIGHDLHSLTNISETVVLRAILCWVDHRKKSREPHLKRLLNTVRWAAIKKDGDEYKSILESTEWKTVIEESFQDTLKKKNPKLSRGSLDVMVVCGAGQSNYNVFFLPINPVTGTRMCMENLTYRRRGHSVIVTGGHMYVIGAGDSLETGHITQCERYDPKTNKWSAIAPLRYGRQNCKLAAINKKIYCLGGHGQYGFEADNEVYDIATNTWSSFPFIEMVAMRADSYIAALNNKLYYLSETGNPSSEPGFVAEEDACLEHPFRLVQCFDPATDKWSAKSPEFGEVKLPPGKVEDCIFVLNKEHQFVYDTKRNTWEQLLTPTCGGIALSLNGLNSLYDHIIRSSDSFYMLHSTGILQTSDPRLGEWELITPEGLPRDFPAANKDHTVILSVPTAMCVHSVTR